MSTQMKVAIAFLTIAFVLFGMAGLYVLQNAEALAEGERLSQQLPMPHDSGIFTLCVLGSFFFGVSLFLAIHATIKPLPKSVFGGM